MFIMLSLTYSCNVTLVLPKRSVSFHSSQVKFGNRTYEYWSSKKYDLTNSLCFITFASLSSRNDCLYCNNFLTFNLIGYWNKCQQILILFQKGCFDFQKSSNKMSKQNRYQMFFLMGNPKTLSYSFQNYHWI